MKLLTYKLGELQTNCYVLIDELTNKAVAIDIGGDAGFLLMEELKHNFKIENVLLTHPHFDHIGGVNKFYKRGCKVYISKEDLPAIKDGNINLSTMFGFDVLPFEAIAVNEGDLLEFGEIKVEVIKTPGHTKGGVTYKVNDMLFCGDTLFAGSMGRTDFPTGSGAQMSQSLARLKALDGDMPVYPGHEEDTTLETERKTNPFM